MYTTLAAIRMSPAMVVALKTLALEEGVRRGRATSWSELVRESCERTLKRARRLRRQAAEHPPRPTPTTPCPAGLDG